MANIVRSIYIPLDFNSKIEIYSKELKKEFGYEMSFNETINLIIRYSNLEFIKKQMEKNNKQKKG